MSYVQHNLNPDEQVVYQTRIHWVVYVMPFILIVIGVLIGSSGSFDRETAHLGETIGAIFIICGVCLFIPAWIRRWASEFAVTSKRVIIKLGWISRRTIELNMSKVESVEVRQSILGRLLNYGTIIVIGTGGTKNPSR